jgi:hypothetical protein
MTMNWSSLTAAKGTAGSIANFIAYGKVQPEVSTILDEAQATLFTLLRTREMRTKMRFYMQTGFASQPLPQRFLDPIGRMYVMDWNLWIEHKDESFLSQNRNYTPSSGNLPPNPFTTTSGHTQVNVSLAAHGFTQDGAVFIAGATAFNGVTINGTFDVVGIPDVNDFTIDITPLGAVPTASGSGGGSSVTYVSDALVAGTPKYWAIWDETIFFDQAFSQNVMCEQLYFQSLPLLSSTNQTNFITTRYPHLLRSACQVRAYEFMRDYGSAQNELTRLTALAQAVSAENDMFYRGMVLDTDTP